jgi:hypothetical protein
MGNPPLQKNTKKLKCLKKYEWQIFLFITSSAVMQDKISNHPENFKG